MLRLLMPANARYERFYIAEVLLHEFLGLQIEICTHSASEVLVTEGREKRLILDDSFFHDLDEPLVRSDKVPALPLARWAVEQSGLDATLVGSDLPVLFGKPLSNGTYFESNSKQISFGIDVLGSAFFMLTRYEEIVSPERDEFDRFPAKASIAYKSGFLDRPIVNEYVEVLWQCLKSLWSGLKRRERSFRVFLSHDVDQPFLLRNSPLSQALRTVAGDALKRKRPDRALKFPMQLVSSHLFGPTYDPAYTFNYIMDVAEKHNLRSAFYFIPSFSAGPPDYRYGILDRDIQKLLADIDRRGHEIGYHASLETYKDRELIQEEVALLRKACRQAGSRQTICGNRQHYLRINVSSTLKYLAEAGLTYDTTLSYADQAGFRSGVCWEYEFYDLEARKRIAIVERPLVVMECSVTDDQYMGLGLGPAAKAAMLKLAGLCRKFSGDFTLLWHNTRLVSSEERSFFESLLAEICPRDHHRAGV
jgi:peptidoglycan/xylan/chitin deacetylase (PgdA/CDA1 family)